MLLNAWVYAVGFGFDLGVGLNGVLLFGLGFDLVLVCFVLRGF